MFFVLFCFILFFTKNGRSVGRSVFCLFVCLSDFVEGEAAERKKEKREREMKNATIQDTGLWRLILLRFVFLRKKTWVPNRWVMGCPSFFVGLERFVKSSPAEAVFEHRFDDYSPYLGGRWTDRHEPGLYIVDREKLASSR